MPFSELFIQHGSRTGRVLVKRTLATTLLVPVIAPAGIRDKKRQKLYCNPTEHTTA
jgi:heterodisulfide reductase subunit A-like polyferredoxin